MATDIGEALWLSCIPWTPLLWWGNFPNYAPIFLKEEARNLLSQPPCQIGYEGLWSGLCPSGFCFGKEGCEEHGMWNLVWGGPCWEPEVQGTAVLVITLLPRVYLWPMVCQQLCSRISTGQAGRETWALFLSAKLPSTALRPSRRFCVLPNNYIYIYIFCLN